MALYTSGITWTNISRFVSNKIKERRKGKKQKLRRSDIRAYQ
jgi:hypothetical protein